jgi:hypothetical protein
MDARKLISELYKENLSTYFILPLLKMNKSRFISEGNFQNSFLTRDGMNIVVQVMDTMFFEHRMIMHPQYLAIWEDKNGMKYVQYSIPSEWQNDVKLFISGKYSHMSTAAKEMIQEWSELQYRVRRESDQVPITDVRLLALDRSIAVRELWENFYNVEFTEDQELLSSPTENDFIDLSTLHKLQSVNQ